MKLDKIRAWFSNQNFNLYLQISFNVFLDQYNLRVFTFAFFYLANIKIY